jgi:methyl-accepting chemotaxis protein
MSWKYLTIGKKIAVGFGTVLILLAVVSVLSYTGVGGIVTNAGQVIDGNKLDGNLAQKEVDHLNWANKVNALLTDEKVTSLEVETNDHKCGFGKWLYGEGRKEAERFVPSLAPLFKEIEEPHRKLHESAIEIGKQFKQADANLPGFLSAKEVDHLKWVAKVNELFLKNLPELKIQTDDHKCSLGKWLHGENAGKAAEGHPELARLIGVLKEPHQQLHQSAVEIQNVYKPVHPGLLITLKDRLDDHRRWASKVSKSIIAQKQDLGVQTDPTRCAFGKFLVSEKTARWMEAFPELKAALEAAKEPHNRLHASAVEIKKTLGAGDKARAEHIFITKTLAALDQVGNHFQEAIRAEQALMKAQHAAKELYETKTLTALGHTAKALGAVKKEAEHMLEGAREANRIYANKSIPALRATQKRLNDIRTEAKRNVMTDQVMLHAAQGTKRNVTIVSTVAILAGILLAFFIARGIIAVLKRISNQMDEGAEQVASASGQVSSASQSLAEGASEQAASIEETSSSLEEMSSMTSQNADNARQTDSLMKEVNQVVGQANDSMTELTESMTEISRASGETAKIIKTIDEIAFQTNLLALNAAVEAARAGEAGAGFAVVAEEVRNLAMRAADAAKNTSDLIEGTVNKINDGSDLVTSTNEAFTQVAESAAKVGELIAEIAAASNEQAQGIGQVNTAVTDMDKVTQQNAANAEESASASEELSAQAGQMKSIVEDLMALVGGASNGAGVEKTRKPPIHQTKAVAIHHAQELSPEQLIPLKNDDFQDF